MVANIEHYDEKDGRAKLNDLNAKSIKGDYTYSKVTDINDAEVTVPAIVLSEPLGDKEKYLGINVESAWQSVMASIYESYLFLHFRFNGEDELTFKFDMFNIKTVKWITRLIETNGIIILCDKSGEFDLGITNIPMDIPMMQLSVIKITAARKSMCIGG